MIQVILTLALLVSPPAHASPSADLLLEIDGKVYPKDTFPESCANLLKGAKCEVPSFGTYHDEVRREGELTHSIAVFTAPEGPQVIEHSWEQSGHVQKATIENRALGLTSSLEIKNGKAIYTVVDKEGRTKTSDEEAEENLVVPSTLMSYLRPHFEEIRSGKPLKVKIAVLDRRESYTFNIHTHHQDKTLSGEEILILEMIPNSFIVRQIVSPMYFYMYPKTGQAFAFEGRSALRRKEGDKYKEIDVRTAYAYQVDRFTKSEHSTQLNDAALKNQNCSSSADMTSGLAPKCEVKSK